MDNTISFLINLIAYKLSGYGPFFESGSISTEDVEKLISLAKRHDISAITGAALLELELISQEQMQERIHNILCESVCYYEKMHYDFQWLCDLFEQAQIPFIPLKGAVVRKFYPEPWMRTSGDIDILIQREYFDQAVLLLLNNGCKREREKRFHDIPLVTPSGNILELHFSICEDIMPMDSVLERVWEYTEPIAEKKYEYRLNDAFFQFHILAHMAYHFLGGGCGIRSFIDIWLLDEKLNCNKELMQKLCCEAKLQLFYENIKTLNAVWFSGKPHTSTSKKLENFIISGSVFGNQNTRVLMEQAQIGSKNRHMLHRVFKPYSELTVQFPSLKDKPWLAPAYQVLRWIRVFTDKRFKKVKSELHIGKHHSDQQIANTKELLENIGLNKQ